MQNVKTKMTDKNLKIKILVFGLSFLFFVFSFLFVNAQALLQPLPGIGSQPAVQEVSDFPDYVNKLIPIIISAIAVLTVIIIIYEGLMYGLSESVETKSNAKHNITQAILGLMIALLSYLILFTINPDLVNLQIRNLNSITVRGTGATGAQIGGAQGILNQPGVVRGLVACRGSTGGAQACYANMADCQNFCNLTCDAGGAGCTQVSHQDRYICMVNGMESSCTQTQSECTSLCSRVGGSCIVASYQCQISTPTQEGCNAYTSQTACNANSQCQWTVAPFHTTYCFPRSQQFGYVCGDNSGIIGCFDNQTSCNSYCANFRTTSSNTGCVISAGTCSGSGITNRPIPANAPTSPNDCRLGAGCPFPQSCVPPSSGSVWQCALVPLGEGAICTDTRQCQTGLTCKPPFAGNPQKRCFR